MAENTLKLSDKGTEYPSRFGGNEVTYATLEPVAGDPHATLDRFLADFCAPDLTPEQQAEVVADYFNGYGLTYRRNGIVKRVLASDDVKELSVEDAIARAVTAANEDRVGVVAKKGTGKSGKVAKAEAKAEAATTAAREMYMGLTASQRKQFRPMLIAQGTFTEQELDEMDASR